MTQRRFGNIQLFARGVSKDDGRYDGLQQGVITYDKSDNYQVSYIELGLRCDHVGHKINPMRNPVSATHPLECDADLMVSKSLSTVSVPDTFKAAENSVVPTTGTV